MKPIYLQIHYKDTKRAISEHIRKYNEALEAEWNQDLKNAYAEFRDKYNLTRKQTFKALTIKGNVQATAFAILDMYAQFLQNNKKRGLVNPVFKMNNVAVATMRNISETTAWRHITALETCKVLDPEAYVFNGSNASFTHSFNSEVLVAMHCPEFTSLVVNNYAISVNNLEIPVEKALELRSMRPLFTDAFNGCMLANCEDIVQSKNQKLNNINMKVAVNVDNSSLSFGNITNDELPKAEYSASEPPHDSKEQGCIDAGKVGTVPASLLAQRGGNKKEQVPAGRAAKKTDLQADITLIQFFCELALRTVLSVLFKDRIINDHDLLLAKRQIWKFFTPEHRTKKLSELSDDFNTVIFEAYKAKQRKLFIPPPLYRYFDPHTKGGFYTTLKHVETVVKPWAARNEEYSKSMADVMKLYNRHMKNPNDFESYRKASQFLGKKKNKQYLQFFNACVVDPKQLTSTTLYNQWNTSVNQPKAN